MNNGEAIRDRSNAIVKKDIKAVTKSNPIYYLMTCLFSLAIVLTSVGLAYPQSDDALFIDQQGNIGIGTPHPEEKLHINGIVKAMGFEGDGAVPKGVIVMWSGKVDDIPAGWALCDGKKDGIPDLRSRFIIGAGSDPSGVDPPHASGEADKLPSVTVATGAAGSHHHKFPKKYYARKFTCGAWTGSDCTGIDTDGDYKREQTTQNDGNHHHSVEINLEKAGSGENRPRWYALCFIIKL